MATAKPGAADPYAIPTQIPRPAEILGWFCDVGTLTYFFKISLPAKLDLVSYRRLLLRLSNNTSFSIKFSPKQDVVAVPLPKDLTVVAYILDYGYFGVASSPGPTSKFTATYKAPAKPGKLSVSSLHEVF